MHRDVQPLVFVKCPKVYLSRSIFEDGDDVSGKRESVAESENSKRLLGMVDGEFGIDGEPELNAISSRDNDSAIRYTVCVVVGFVQDSHCIFSLWCSIQHICMLSTGHPLNAGVPLILPGGSR